MAINLSSLLSLLFLFIWGHSLYADGVSFHISRAVDSNLRSFLHHDFKTLERFNVSKDNPYAEKLAELLDVPRIDRRFLNNWASERINYIIDLREEKKLGIYLSENSFNPERPIDNGAFFLYDREDIFEEGRGMSNLGTSLYHRGVAANLIPVLPFERRPFLLFFSRKQDILISSPAVGVIQLGNALFDPRFALRPFDPKSEANTLARLSSFFHEARHSDRESDPPGFLHSRCPWGHDFEGQFNCDDREDGAYGIQALILGIFKKDCKSCSVGDLERLEVRRLDRLNRIQMSAP